MVTSSFGGFYSGKRVLVTGHSGFKGSWLWLWLKSLGAELLGLSLEPPFSPSLFAKAELAKDESQQELDIRDRDALNKAVAGFQPEVVLHLAAQSLVRTSYDNPVDTFSTNLMGLVNICDAVRATESVRSFVFVSSDKCYENKEWVWAYRENDPFGGSDPYSASKGAGEIVFESFCRSFFRLRESLGAASARAGNVIGGGDWSQDRIVPDCIRALSNDQQIVVRNPGHTRPWQYVLEPLSGYLWLAAELANDTKAYTGGWNFSPSVQPAPVSELVEEVVKAWGSGSWLDASQKQTGSPKEAKALRLANEKAENILSWRTALDFRETIKYTTDDYRAFINNSGVELREIATSRIKTYTEAAAAQGIAWAIGA
ncbi:MAG: CDP-glucose 4,6-dehydratase [Planctomycetes bacterium]|nr:CDP-glucose 4,6-dehydratase [Planctomycetota bacterium]